MIDLIVKVLVWIDALWDHFFAQSTIRFSSIYGDYHIANPTEAIRKKNPEWFDRMVEKVKAEKKAGNKKAVVKFVRCPGMHDYMHEGYLILAHTDIHIKANGVTVLCTTPQIGDKQLHPTPMEFPLVDGMAPIQDDVFKQVIKVPLPIGIFMKRKHSAHLLPALMHSPFLDKVFVYPGTVDYGKKFSTANFIFSVTKPCEFVIPAGTPLLQVLPFKRVSYHGITGPASRWEHAVARFGFPSRVLGYYRKMFHEKKLYTSEVKE